MPVLNSRGLPHNGKPLKKKTAIPIEESVERRLLVVREHFDNGHSMPETARITGIPERVVARLVRELRIKAVLENMDYVDQQLALSLSNTFETSLVANEQLHDPEFLRTAEPERIQALYEIASDTGTRILQFAAIRAKFGGERPEAAPLLANGGR